MKPDYSYQTALINQIYEKLHSGRRKVVLAAAPGAGKTTMAVKIIQRFQKNNPDAKILILTHGQTVLRQQWATVLANSGIHYHEVKNQTDVDASTRVYVAIPQSYKAITQLLKSIDLLIIDEAHHYYAGKLISMIKSSTKPDKELLLTGTPSPYIDTNWEIVGITLQELLEYKTIVDPRIEIIQSEYSFKFSDYTEDFELKPNIYISKKQTIKNIHIILDNLVDRLSAKINQIDKTMIVCQNQTQAKYIFNYLVATGHKTLLSISDYNNDDTSFNQFRSDPSYIFMVVVNRGILGFDFPVLCNMVDLTGSLNVNRLFQMLCRVIRRSGRPKLFLKLTSKEMSLLTHYVMSFVVALSDKKYYFTYKFNKKLLDGTKIPVPTEFMEAIKKHRKGGGQYKLPDLPSICSFKIMSDLVSDGITKSIAYTNFKTVKQLLYNERHSWSIEDAFIIANKFKRQRKTYRDFCLEHSGAIQIIERCGRKEEFHKILPITNGQWTLEKCEALAKECKTPTEFKRKYSAASDFIRKQNHTSEFDKWFADKRLVAKRLTKEEVLAYVNQCKTLTEWTSSSAYKWVRRHNAQSLVKSILDKIPNKRLMKMESKL